MVAQFFPVYRARYLNQWHAGLTENAVPKNQNEIRIGETGQDDLRSPACPVLHFLLIQFDPVPYCIEQKH